MKNANHRTAAAALIVALLSSALVLDATAPAFAGVRSKSRSSVSSKHSSTNVNVNTHRDVDVNVDVDVDHRGGYYRNGCCYHDDFHPVAAVAAAVVTAAVIGSIVSSLPSGCQTVIVNGFGYQQCGNTWYQPQMSGSTTTYVVINPPR